jgi:hypothetical protein
MVLIGLADHLEERFCPSLGKWDISQFIQNE